MESPSQPQVASPSHQPLWQIVFDLDGTLVDTLDGIDWSMRMAVRRVLGSDYSCPPIDHLVGPPLRQMLARAFPEQDDATRERMSDAFREHYDADGWARSVLYEGVRETLKQLHASGQTLHVLTNKRFPAARRILEHFDLAPLFASVSAPGAPNWVFADKVGALGGLLRAASASPACTWMVGDSPDDFDAARQNGARFVAAAYGYGRVCDAPAAGDYPRIEHFAQLVTAL